MTPEIILVPVNPPAELPVDPPAELPVDPPAELPVDPPAEPQTPSESSDSSVMLPDEPTKRGRGRPPGAKNKAKPDVEPPTPRNAKVPRVTKKPTPIEEDIEEEEAPMPPPAPVKKKKSPVVLPRIKTPEIEPASPRSQSRQIHVDAQTRRVDLHTNRVRGYSTLLDTMLAY
jgi:hypothetical protein